MEKRTIGTIATIVVILFCGIFGLYIGFVLSLPTLIGYIPAMSGAALNVGSSDPSKYGLLGGMGSCCICIPIPLIFSFFALFRQRAHAAVGEEPISD